jgi:hypothetical protein
MIFLIGRLPQQFLNKLILVTEKNALKSVKLSEVTLAGIGPQGSIYDLHL